MDLQKFIADGGLKSRKLWLAVGCILVMAIMILVAVHFAVVVGLYADFVGGVVAIYSIYAGVNVVNRYGTAKHLGAQLNDANSPLEDTK